MRYLIGAAIGLGLLVLAFWGLPAKADEPSCIKLETLEPALLPLGYVEVTNRDDDAQRLADALSEHFGSQKLAVATVAAFINRAGTAFVFGFDPAGCSNIAGRMALPILDDARAVAKLPRLLPADDHSI